MSGGNAELVHAAFDAWNRRDVEAILALCEPDVEVRSLMTEAECSTYLGLRGVREWLSAVLEVFPDWHPTVGAVEDLGHAVVVRFQVTATARGSGIRIDQGYWLAARLSEARRLTFWGFFRTEALAREAAGVMMR